VNSPPCYLSIALAFFLLIAAPFASAQEQLESTSTPKTTYVFFQRTSGHVKASRPEVFQQVVDDIKEYLKTNRIAAVTEQNVPSSGAELPLSAVQEMARGSKAAYLLYVVVDRPVSHWLKVTVRCYDATGRLIWEEQSAAGGLVTKVDWTSRQGVRDTLEKLHEELNKRLEQPGLLRVASAQEQPVTESTGNPVAPGGSREDTGETVRLANGTPVHLLLAESISSKTAKPGSPVKLQVFGDVKVGDLIVIANKAPAFGTVEAIEGAGRAWRAGKIVLKLRTVTLLNQQQQSLRAWSAVKGEATNAGNDWTSAVFQTYGFAVLFLPFAPLQHGNQAILPRGTVLEAVIGGDVLLPRDAIKAAQPEPAKPRHGPASVTIYYPDSGHGPSVDVWCGEVNLGRLQRGGKFTLTLPSGKYRLRLAKRVKKGFDTPLDAEDGGEEYVSVTVSRRQAPNLDVSWPPSLLVVPHDVGEAQSADTTSAKSRNVLDLAKLDLAQLQADPQAKKK
jgi:hypothetical protein